MENFFINFEKILREYKNLKSMQAMLNGNFFVMEKPSEKLIIQEYNNNPNDLDYENFKRKIMDIFEKVSNE